jgi:hypothetical protein
LGYFGLIFRFISEVGTVVIVNMLFLPSSSGVEAGANGVVTGSAGHKATFTLVVYI